MSYILLIFNDQNNKELNAIWLFESMKQIMTKTKGLLKYSDINKRVRHYKTCKSFFIILKLNNKDKRKYFLL